MNLRRVVGNPLTRRGREPTQDRRDLFVQLREFLGRDGQLERVEVGCGLPPGVETVRVEDVALDEALVLGQLDTTEGVGDRPGRRRGVGVVLTDREPDCRRAPRSRPLITVGLRAFREAEPLELAQVVAARRCRDADLGRTLGGGAGASGQEVAEDGQAIRMGERAHGIDVVDHAARRAVRFGSPRSITVLKRILHTSIVNWVRPVVKEFLHDRGICGSVRLSYGLRMSEHAERPARRRLDGRRAVVVGAGQTPGATIGNGRATAITFAREGAHVLLVDRSEEQLADTVAMIEDELAESGSVDMPTIATLVVDIAAHDAPDVLVRAAVDALGGIDVLHNNVGIGLGDGPPHRLTDDGYDRIMDVNLRAMWRTCRAAVPVLRESEHGAIVNVSSLAAIASAGNLTAYRLSKAGVNTLTTSLAVTNAKHGVRANAIMPGFVDTPMGVDAAANALGVDRDEFAAGRARQVPLGRQGSAWDVANAALFLASDEAAWITGVILPVDGGQSMRIG